MRLETPRLILREVELDDAEAFFKFSGDPRFYQFIANQPTLESTRERTRKWAENSKKEPRTFCAWTILKKDDSRVIGNIRLWPETDEKKLKPHGIVGMGYGLDPEYWGQGYMTEALVTATKFAHDVLNMHRVEAAAIAENIGSWKILEKAGFIRDGEKRYRYQTQGTWRELVYEYASVRPDLIP